MCVGRHAEKMQWSEAKWILFEMPAIEMSVLCIPAECDNIKLPIEYEIASRWNANLLYDICRYFASVMLHFASLISHNLRCIPAYAHLIPTGFFLLNYHRDNLYIISFFLCPFASHDSHFVFLLTQIPLSQNLLLWVEILTEAPRSLASLGAHTLLF